MAVLLCIVWKGGNVSQWDYELRVYNSVLGTRELLLKPTFRTVINKTNISTVQGANYESYLLQLSNQEHPSAKLHSGLPETTRPISSIAVFCSGVSNLTHWNCIPGPHQVKGDHFTRAGGRIGVHLLLFWTWILSTHRVLDPASSMRIQSTGLLLPCRAISAIT